MKEGHIFHVVPIQKKRSLVFKWLLLLYKHKMILKDKSVIYCFNKLAVEVLNPQLALERHGGLFLIAKKRNTVNHSTLSYSCMEDYTLTYVPKIDLPLYIDSPIKFKAFEDILK